MRICLFQRVPAWGRPLHGLSFWMRSFGQTDLSFAPSVYFTDKEKCFFFFGLLIVQPCFLYSTTNILRMQFSLFLIEEFMELSLGRLLYFMQPAMIISHPLSNFVARLEFLSWTASGRGISRPIVVDLHA